MGVNPWMNIGVTPETDPRESFKLSKIHGPVDGAGRNVL